MRTIWLVWLVSLGVGVVQAQNYANFTSTTQSIDSATFYASQFAGADMGAKINTAAAACSGGNSCKVKIPAGFYSYSTAIVAPQSVVIEGEGPESSWLQYTGTGAAVTLSGAWAQIKDVVLQCTAACTYLVNMTGGSNVADNLLVQGGTSATKFFGIHGPNGRISNIVGSNISGTLYECDNAVNNYINNSQSFGVRNNTTMVVVDMNSGCNNLQVLGLQNSYSGLHGFIMRNTLTGGTPTGAFFTNFATDQSSGGSQWVFDSTLGDSADNFVQIVNGFAGSAGRNTDTTIATATAIGIDIEGGRNISIDNVNVIDAAATGVLINNSQVTNVKITNSFINNNNANNTASTNGVTISAAASGIRFAGNTIGNLVGDNRGHQKYGIAITSSTAANVDISGNDLNNNETGTLSNSMTSNYTISGNLPTSSNFPLVCAGCVAVANLTAQAASISATTIYIPPANGYYMVCMEQVITQTPTSGGNTGYLTMNYTSAVDNHAKFPTLPTGNPGNKGTPGVFTVNSGCMPAFVQASTPIHYGVDGYSAGTGTPMQYALNITVLSLNPTAR
jgi:hypothetical protein